MIWDDDNAHEHVLSVSKLLEQQYQILLVIGEFFYDDVDEEVDEIIVTVIQENDAHEVIEI